MKDPIKQLEGMVHKIPVGVPLKKVSKKQAEATRKKLVKLEDEALLKELERESNKAHKSTMTVTAVDPEKLKWIESSSEFIPTSERTYEITGNPGKKRITNLLQKVLALLAIAISLGLMVAGVKVVLELADKTGVAIVVTVLLAYCIAINIRKFDV